MRHQARELALQILFQTEFAPQISYEQFLEVFEQSFSQSVIDYADSLIKGVSAFRSEIDMLIQSSSQHWKIERMSFVDRNILRIATFEMKMAEPLLEGKIAINEAVELAKKYGATESPGFVNGLLDQVQRTPYSRKT